MVCAGFARSLFERPTVESMGDACDRSPAGAPIEGDTWLIEQTATCAVFETELLDCPGGLRLAWVRWINRRSDGYLHPGDGDRIVAIDFGREREP